MLNLYKFNYVYIILTITLLIITLYILYKFYFNVEKFSSEEAVVENVPNDKTNNSVKGEIILYYATWCGYSRMFLPEWEKFSKFAKSNLPQVKVSQIRCEGGNENTCKQKGVQGYPTVILYPTNGTEVIFSGERNSDELVKFVQTHL